jgi:hypothetical protein
MFCYNVSITTVIIDSLQTTVTNRIYTKYVFDNIYRQKSTVLTHICPIWGDIVEEIKNGIWTNKDSGPECVTPHVPDRDVTEHRRLPYYVHIYVNRRD